MVMVLAEMRRGGALDIAYVTGHCLAAAVHAALLNGPLQVCIGDLVRVKHYRGGCRSRIDMSVVDARNGHDALFDREAIECREQAGNAEVFL